jgi:hypothetical protein
MSGTTDGTASLCVVGAGAAGAGAAEALRDADADVDVTVLEKSRGVCGRAATRRRDGCRYDHGANYVKDPDERTTALVRELGTEGLVDVTAPVWTFDAAGTIAPGDDRDEHKWTWTGGITQLAKRLFARTDAEVETGVRVESLDRTATGWAPTSAEGESFGPFDAVLLTPPAPQTAALLAETAWEDERLPALREAAGAVSYRTIRTVVLHYPFEAERPWYALVDTSKEHAVGWVSREECKAGHVPDGESLLVVQMSPAWSRAHYDDPLESVAPDVAGRVAALVDDDRLREYDWADDQGWRYALPEGGADAGILRRGEDAGLYFAGDWVAGEGRVHRALWNGHDAGERVGERFG